MAASTSGIVTDGNAKQWTTVCQLTDPAMYALVDVEQELMSKDVADLSPLEFRAMVWARASLAFLYGVRADEAVGFPVLAHPGGD